MMKILVLNRGSSSIKCSLYEIAGNIEKLLWQAHIEWKNNFEKALLKTKNHLKQEHLEECKGKTADEVVRAAILALCQGKTAVLSSLEEVNAAGHRIVHGGKKFRQTMRITNEVKEGIKALSELAPLHNTADLEGIEILERLFPEKPQFAVFDTAFHRTMPEEACIYPGPYRWVEEDLQRYGFHGISYQYCTKKAEELLKHTPQRMVICHLGSGASLCAVKEGNSIDTTMGFTPLEGLMMDTRSGTVDPGLLLHLLEKKKKTAKEVSEELNQHSGLLGVSGFSSDMRDIIEKSSENKRAKLALDIYIHRLNALIGSMVASLQGLDAIVFTAGIGENSPLIRKEVSLSFSFLGMALDEKKNEDKSNDNRILSTEESKVKILLIHTNESLEIARECGKNLAS